MLARDSGMLLLDNPFGKATTLAEFVDLQVQMARLMGVQLIYATGTNVLKLDAACSNADGGHPE